MYFLLQKELKRNFFWTKRIKSIFSSLFGPERNRKHFSVFFGLIRSISVTSAAFHVFVPFGRSGASAEWYTYNYSRNCSSPEPSTVPTSPPAGAPSALASPPMPTMLRGPPADNAPRPPSKGANDCETNGSRESKCNETSLGNALDAKQHFKKCVNAWAGVHLFLDHAEAALPYFRMLFLNPHKIN